MRISEEKIEMILRMRQRRDAKFYLNSVSAEEFGWNWTQIEE